MPRGVGSDGEEGWRALGAGNGREALDLIAAQPDRPDVIVLDLMMPVMDGEQFRQVQRADPSLASIPVVAITAGRHNPARLEALAPDAFLPKPLRLEDLLETIEKLAPRE